MKIDDQLLSKLERLGMIEIEESKKEEIKAQLSEILGFVDNIATLDTQALSSKIEQKTPMREDIPHDSQIQQDVLSHAPRAEDGYFIVPKIIE
ncbi:Asp-tRNA(Asn)/Glu-tRNA(Gln) amidotransferase subunit GatC [Helicobacter brantae]|uniref:Aspartyl/glutamyl-tRNA(Asn/Gln) amidotransferase subunit C n=1 Tax=Helicobacter brantae TaxID=375927 RepID=A0A3D8J3P5_9HELI|nr:Asp-tRNA(Asn)/Glu-tRNA(Gln) amidotransferase subunit GatC [Helicobacter brantae]RDU71860.1 Asp-tRNA(Asn)/Glu-tRNA(Gln) amidotransferase subunit GatC [Helicobacter brantae]